jgi:chromosome segregation ATPase
MNAGDRLTNVLRHSAARMGSPVWRRLRPRMETIANRAAAEAADRAAERAITHADDVAGSLRGDLDQLRQEIGRLRGDVDALRGDVDTLRGRMDEAAHHNRLLPEQVAALEVRFGELEAERRLAVVDNGDASESRTALDEIRSEHQRIRARLAVMASYEERLGRLENTISGRQPS